MSDAFDLSAAIVHNSPTPSWPATAALTRLECRADGVHVEFSKQDGPGRWPDVIPPGWTGSIQYTLWFGMLIDGAWHVAGLQEYWYGLAAQGGDITAPAPPVPPSTVSPGMQIPANWTYDCGPMARQPVPGEIVAFFVTAGDQRKKDVWEVHERSQVVTVPFPRAVPAVFTFEATPPAPDPPGPIPGPVPPDLAPILARITALEGRVKTLEEAPPPVCPPLPDYYGEGRAPMFGGTVRVTSQPKV